MSRLPRSCFSRDRVVAHGELLTTTTSPRIRSNCLPSADLVKSKIRPELKLLWLSAVGRLFPKCWWHCLVKYAKLLLQSLAIGRPAQGRDFPASAEHSDREPSIRGHYSQFFRDRSGIVQLTVKNCQPCSIPGEGEVTLDLVTGITAMSTRSPPSGILRDRACKGWNESREPFHPLPRPPRGPIAHSVRGSSRKRQWCGLPATKLHT